MNIYIYGNQSFKKEIHETLDHSNIKFKLDNETSIKEINSASELMEIIKNNPKDVYLIDDEKIIKKNSLNQKIKFLKPKDGIEEEFLLDSGIADLTIDSLKEIPKYILKKYDEEKLNRSYENQVESSNDLIEVDKNKIELDEELASLLAKEEITEKITNSNDDNLDDLFDLGTDINLDKIDDIIGDVEDNSNQKISKEEFNDIMDFNNSFGLNNISFDYDDEEIVNDDLEEIDFLAKLESKEDSNDEVFEDIDFLDEIFAKKEQTIDKKEENIELEEIAPLKGEIMPQDEFSELDLLNEKDLLEALNYSNKDLKEIFKENSNEIQKDTITNNMSIDVIESTNVNELASLISKLLNNKTLEITIKIKD